MRPIYLSMSAFGPFAGTETVEFARLGDNPLFLINGPTGSGKTTILDAICFALYGETTSGERQAREMRCDYAEPDILTEVVLTFTLARETYKIRRVPDQERPKSRGEGFTVQNAEAQLWRIGVNGEENLLIPKKISEANEKLVDLTGLSADQFRQVMVLPQGKFRDLLLADSNDREKIFRQLFQTQIYSQLESRLKEQANTLSNAVKGISKRQEGILEGSGINTLDELQDKIRQSTQIISQLAAEKGKIEKAFQKAQNERQQAEQLEKQFQELELNQLQLKQLELKQNDMAQCKQQLQFARQARDMEPVFNQCQQQKTLFENAKRNLEKQQKQQQFAQENLKSAELIKQQSQAQQLQLDEVKLEISKIEIYLNRYLKLIEARKKHQHVMQQFEQASKNTEQLQTLLSEKQQQLEKLEAQILDLRNKLQDLPFAQNQLEKIQNFIQFKQKLVISEQKHTHLLQAQETARQSRQQLELKHQQSVRRRKILENAWQMGQAAILAQQLTEHDACPVCGSYEHPEPATFAGELPNEQELETARTSEDKITSEKNQVIQQLSEIQADMNSLQDNHQTLQLMLADAVMLSPDELQQQLKQWQNSIKQLQENQQTLSKNENLYTQLKQTIHGIALQLERASAALSENTLRLTAATAEVEHTLTELPEAFRQAGELEKSLQRLNDKRQDLFLQIETSDKQYRQAREQISAANVAVGLASQSQEENHNAYLQAEQVWLQVLHESPFENESFYRSALIDDKERESKEKSLRQFEDALLLASENVKRLEEKLLGQSRPILSFFHESEKQMADKIVEFTAGFHHTHSQLEQFKKTEKTLQKNIGELQKLETEYALIGTLSEISNGKNAYNLSLQRFVLTVLLDDVLIEAGYRLSEMSRGRYQLYRKESVVDRRSKSGLDLEVEDAYTGKRRAVATLSGGESFIAALSLALGLSDVVQAYAGGVRLDTLFIDEGFGSLDPEALELAINTLVDLQAAGRMVGVISHVPELKERIDSRLDIVSKRNGSHIKMVLP